MLQAKWNLVGEFDIADMSQDPEFNQICSAPRNLLGMFFFADIFICCDIQMEVYLLSVRVVFQDAMLSVS